MGCTFKDYLIVPITRKVIKRRGKKFCLRPPITEKIVHGYFYANYIPKYKIDKSLMV